MTDTLAYSPAGANNSAAPHHNIDHRVGLLHCLAALATVAAIVGGAHLAALALANALPLWTDAVPPAIAMLATPLLIGIYQLALLALAIAWFDRDRSAALSLKLPALRLWHWLAIIVALYALKAAASIAVLGLTGPPAAPAGSAAPSALDGLAPFAAVMKSSGWPLLLAGGIIAAVVEELLYRGFLSKTLEGSRLGFWGGALVASIVWAGLHLYYPLGLQAVLVIMGLALSWLRARTGSVYPGMAWHIANNVIALIALRALA